MKQVPDKLHPLKMGVGKSGNHSHTLKTKSTDIISSHRRKRGGCTSSGGDRKDIPKNRTRKEGINIKEGANIKNLAQQIVNTFDDIVDIWAENGAPTPVITSGNDSVHGEGSLHYEDRAIDLRGNNVDDDTQDMLANKLRDRLGEDYNVVSETDPKDPANDHIHVEYQPH